MESISNLWLVIVFVASTFYRHKKAANDGVNANDNTSVSGLIMILHAN